MDLLNCRAGISMCQTKQTLTYDHTPVLTFSICHLKVALRHSQRAQNSINSQIGEQVCDFLHVVTGALYRQAVANYHYTQDNGYPFHPFDAVLDYEITYNGRCHLSLYRDQYAFTGGAHGSTLRASDTWNLMSGRSVPLSDFFPEGFDYRGWLIDQIIRQAGDNPEILFEDYPGLIVQYFNEEHYYLTDGGLAVYFQQYEIAPYSTGIVVFTIPCGEPLRCP